MRKTTVYLDDEDAAGLRRLAATTGRSQAELIRDAVRQAVAAGPQRRFRSLGLGAGGGAASTTWDAEELYRQVVGD